jgi:hypothetical protein
MVLAIQHPRWRWVFNGMAVLLSLVELFTMEYFAGLELIRPVFLWLLVLPKPGKRWKRITATIRLWLPYLLGLIFFFAWRVFFIQLPGKDRNAPELLHLLGSHPAAGLLQLIKMALQDVSFIVVTTWYKTFQPDFFDFSSQFTIIALVVGAACGILVWIFLEITAKGPEDSTAPQAESLLTQARTLLLSGALIVFAGPLPAWITNRQVIVGLYSDRLALPAMLGAAMLIAGLIAWLIRSQRQQHVVVCLLLTLSVAYHLQIVNEYRWARIQQNRFYWQLSWRAPGIVPGTAIFADAEILPSTGLYSTASGINMIYAQPGTAWQLPYWFFSLSREFPHRLNELAAGIPLEASFRQFTFQGSSQNSLIVYYNPNEADCMRVVTPADGSDPALSAVVRQALPISNLTRIEATSSQKNIPNRDIFEGEPAHGWCYYFQKADLARQEGDWESVAKLGDDAQEKGFTMDNSQSNTPQEWIIFIEGYAHQGRWQEAQAITRAALAREPKMQPRLCADWQALSKDISGAGPQAETVFNELNCQQQ